MYKICTWIFSILLVANTTVGAQTQVDEAEWPEEAPFVSPYGLKKESGAKPVTALRKVGAAESRYFQFVSAGTKDEISHDGDLALTMVWKKKTGNTPAHYELALEKLTNLNDEPGQADSRVRLERTLWEVRARKYPNSPVLYYTLINKASQLPLQLRKDASSVEIVSGSTDWLWADGAEAAVTDVSNVDPSLPSLRVLQNYIRAAVDPTQTMYLVRDRSTGDVKLKLQNSNEPVPGEAIRFEAWEANPIVLTASQINSELGYEQVTTEGKGTKDAFRFTFSRDVEGENARNVMTEYAFKAVSAEGAEAGDGTKGYVRFQAWEDGELSDKYLMVDTVYHDSGVNEKYDLQLAVKKIEYPKYALVADGGKASTYAKIALSQLKRQSNFKAVFYPSTQSLHLQVEVLFKSDKNVLINHPDANRPLEVSWWGQMYYFINNGDMFVANTTPEEYFPSAKGAYFLPYTATNPPVVPLKWGDGFRYFSPAVAFYDTGLNYSYSYDSWFNGIDAKFVFANKPLNNVIRLTALTDTPSHRVLTCGVRDPYDEENAEGYDGLQTRISLEGLMPIYTEVADIDPGFYYIQNAHTISTDLLKSGEYRYEDLAATTATYAYWNALDETWSVGDADPSVTNPGENGKRTASLGNIVYSRDLKEIPSAQWYFDGNGGYYTLTNRESGRNWGTNYWWKLAGSDDRYVNHNAYSNGTGLTGGLRAFHRDTIRLVPVADAVLKDIHRGYLDWSAAEAEADTCAFRFGFPTIGSEDWFLGEENGLLKVVNEHPGRYKLERVVDRTSQMQDVYDGSEHFQDSLVYGFNPSGKPEYQLARAMYYIYTDEVSSSSTEATGMRTRKYITLEGGRYSLVPSRVRLDANGYTTYDPSWNNGKADSRRPFYIKRISTVDPDQFVGIDPIGVGREVNANGAGAQGVRMFVDQTTGEVQPGGLVSSAAANAYDNSVFVLNKMKAYNYRDIRTEGNIRDTLTFFKASDPSIGWFENSRVKGANVGLLDRFDAGETPKNEALFVDTADLAKPEKPMFLLAVRPKDTFERSNRPDHNRHLYTAADYLVNLADSAKAGHSVYQYTNVAQQIERTYYRLGFVPAVHQGSSLFIRGNDNEEIALNNGLTKASFAFRYVDADRDRFYIETIYDGTTPGWVMVLNEVPVVTSDIQQAEVYQVKKATSVPTANETITGKEGVSVEAIRGALVIKLGAGKRLTVTDLLGRPLVANRLLSSDYEKIAVPAGLVMVGVEGTKAVKVVVK